MNVSSVDEIVDPHRFLNELLHECFAEFIRDVQQRNHDGKSADDLPQIGEIVQIHGLKILGQNYWLGSEKIGKVKPRMPQIFTD